MTRQTVTAKNGTEAFKMIHDFLGKEISFSNVSEGYNREDIFTFTADEGIFISATCTPGNSRVECIEIINTNEGGSARHPLTVYIIDADAESTATVKEEPKMTIETTKNVNDIAAAYKAANESVRVHFTPKGNIAWQARWKSSEKYNFFSTCRISKKDAAEYLSKYGLSTEQFVEIYKAIEAQGDAQWQQAKAQGRRVSRGYVDINAVIEKLYGEPAEADVDDYAVNTDAQDAATKAEIEAASLAQKNVAVVNGNYSETINGEEVTFTNFSISKIIAPRLGFGYSTETGKGKFYSLCGGVIIYRPVAKKRIYERYAELELAADQLAAVKNFFDAYDAGNDKDFFRVQINLDLADGQKLYVKKYFNYFNQTIDFANAVIKKFSGEVKFFIATDRNDINEHHRYVKRDREGYITYDFPATSYYAKMPASEIQNQIDGINKAIAENEKFAEQNKPVWSELMTANHRLLGTRAFLEFALHDNEHAHQEPTEPEQSLDDNESVFNLLPNIDELNDTRSDYDIWEEQWAGEETDRNDRFNRGDIIAKAATDKICKVDPTAAITFDIDGDGKDRFWISFDGIVRTPFATADDAESFFYTFRQERVAETASVPGDSFKAKLAALKAEYDKAEQVTADKKAALTKAEEEYHDAAKRSAAALQDLLILFANVERQLDQDLLADFPLSFEMEITAQNGQSYKTKFTEPYFVFGDIGEDISLMVFKDASNITWKFAAYDTPDQMKVAVGMLQDAIARGEKKFTFPTADAPPKLTADIAEQCDLINEAAHKMSYREARRSLRQLRIKFRQRVNQNRLRR